VKIAANWYSSVSRLCGVLPLLHVGGAAAGQLVAAHS